MAPHWGWIELRTSPIAKAITKKWWFSLYSFEWIKKQNNSDLHITSAKFDEPIALWLANSHRNILTIHWCVWDQDIIYIGWRNEEIRETIRQYLIDNWFVAPEFEKIDIKKYGWIYDTNICNRWLNEKGWVQLELSKSLRLKLSTEKDLLACFTDPIVSWLNEFSQTK